MRYVLYIAIFLLLRANLYIVQGQDLYNIGKERPFGLDGNLELRGTFYKANGIAERMQPYNYYLSGNPEVSLYGWRIPMSFSLSKKQTSFQQPFNRFGLSPTYKWITLHMGHRNVQFSPYTLAGHAMLGGGIELKPGKFRMGFMIGRLNKATVIDTVSMSLVPFSFSRKGMAVKVGYGTDQNFFDLHFLRAKDDSTTAPLGMEALMRQVTAQANSVLGYGAKFTFFKKLTLESDAAISVLTRDINSQISLDSILDPTLRKWGRIFDINGTSEWFLAFNTAIGYKEKNYGIKANYRRVEPGFTSMGAYYFSNDIENLTINPSYSHPKGRLRANVSFGIERDNVRLQKQATTKRIIASGNLSSEITGRLGVDLIFSNFSNNQKPNTLKFADSLKIVQTTRSIGLMPRYTISGAERMQMILMSVNFSEMNDYNGYFDNSGAAPSRDINTAQYLLNYNLSFPQRRMSFNSSLNYTKLSSAATKNSYRGVSMGGNYTLANRALTVGANFSLMQGDNNGNKSSIFNSSANASYHINRRQSIRMLFYFTNNQPGSVVTGVNPTFSETRGEIAYQLNFGL